MFDVPLPERAERIEREASEAEEATAACAQGSPRDSRVNPGGRTNSI